MLPRFEFESSDAGGSTKPIGQHLHQLLGYLTALTALLVTASNTATIMMNEGVGFWEAMLSRHGVGVAVFAIPALLSVKFRWIQIAMFATVGFVANFLDDPRSMQPLLWILAAALLAWHYGYLTRQSRWQIIAVAASLAAVWLVGIAVALQDGLTSASGKILGGSLIIGLVWTIIMNQVRTYRRTAIELSNAVKERTAELRAALESRNDLVRELHHQTKNSLQIVSAVLAFEHETLNADTMRKTLENSAERIHALARVHDQLLSSTSIGKVELNPFLQTFVEDAFVAVAKRQATLVAHVETESVISSEFALTLGLLLNEVLYSILECLPDTPEETLISLAATEQEGTLAIAADADGPSVELNENGRVSIGVQITRSVVERAGGQMDFSSGNGISWQISIPLDTFLAVETASA